MYLKFIILFVLFQPIFNSSPPWNEITDLDATARIGKIFTEIYNKDVPGDTIFIEQRFNFSANEWITLSNLIINKGVEVENNLKKFSENLSASYFDTNIQQHGLQLIIDVNNHVKTVSDNVTKSLTGLYTTGRPYVYKILNDINQVGLQLKEKIQFSERLCFSKWLDEVNRWESLSDKCIVAGVAAVEKIYLSWSFKLIKISKVYSDGFKLLTYINLSEEITSALEKFKSIAIGELDQFLQESQQIILELYESGVSCHAKTLILAEQYETKFAPECRKNV